MHLSMSNRIRCVLGSGKTSPQAMTIEHDFDTYQVTAERRSAEPSKSTRIGALLVDRPQ